MRSTLSLISIGLAIFTVLPAAASSSTSTYLPAAPRTTQQYGLMNDNQFACPTATTAQTGYGNRTTETKVRLNARTAQYQANHGVVPVGVVGVKIDSNLNGGIIAEYPPSNLWKFGIVPGDQIVAVEGKPINYYTFESICRGTPGQLRNLAIVHNGQIRKIAVPLVDARRCS